MIEQMQGKMKCPICKAMVKNVNLHFQRRLECGNNVDMAHFQSNFQEYKKRADRRRWRKDANERKNNSRKKKIDADTEKYKKDNADAQKKRRKIREEKNPIDYRQELSEAQRQ